MFGKILLAVDESDHSVYATELTGELRLNSTARSSSFTCTRSFPPEVAR